MEAFAKEQIPLDTGGPKDINLLYNVEDICYIPEIVELNIGHSIIAQAVFSGLDQTVQDLKHIMRQARLSL